MNHQRFIGLELSGAKNTKTTLAVLEYYPKEKKIFLLDLHSGIGSDEHADSDQALIESIQDHAETPGKGQPALNIGVSTPLTLPPCITCDRKACSSSKNTLPECQASEVKWMKQFYSKHHKAPPKKPVSKRVAQQKEFITPYTQRPVDLWLRYEVLKKMPEKARFDLDETLGGSRAPLTARMHYLQRFLKQHSLIEVHPKFTVALLMPRLKLTFRHLRLYRSLDQGLAAREIILERMCDQLGIFIYDRDFKKLTGNLNSFDAFLCAYTAILKSRGDCVTAPRGFPADSGWVYYPKSSMLEEGFDESAFLNAGEEDLE